MCASVLRSRGQMAKAAATLEAATKHVERFSMKHHTLTSWLGAHVEYWLVAAVTQGSGSGQRALLVVTSASFHSKFLNLVSLFSDDFAVITCTTIVTLTMAITGQ